MKFCKYFAACVFSIFILCSCSQRTPEDVVLKYYEAAERLDFETAKTYVAKDAFAIFDVLIDMTADEQQDQAEEVDSDIRILIKSVEVSDDDKQAMVIISKAAIDGLIVDEVSIRLIKEEGEWKITL